jgi:hypothetical protein
MQAGIDRIGIISLVSAADRAAPLAPPGLGLRREPSGAVAAAAAATAADQPKARSGLTASELELGAVPYAAPLTAVAASNQKLLLLSAFLQIGDWELAQALMRWLRTLGLADFAILPAVGQALCEFLPLLPPLLLPLLLLPLLLLLMAECPRGMACAADCTLVLCADCGRGQPISLRSCLSRCSSCRRADWPGAAASVCRCHCRQACSGPAAA